MIHRPKDHASSVTFSPCGGFMAVATRKECKDAVSVYGTEQWNAICSFPTATLDLAALTWSPDGGSIMVQDTRLCYRLLVLLPEVAYFVCSCGMRAQVKARLESVPRFRSRLICMRTAARQVYLALWLRCMRNAECNRAPLSGSLGYM